MSTPAAAEELQYEVEMLQKRLKRRNNLLDEIRRAYMKDVITVARQMAVFPFPARKVRICTRGGRINTLRVTEISCFLFRFPVPLISM